MTNDSLRRTITTEVQDAGDGNGRAVARLVDPFHDIEVELLMRMDDLTIIDAGARMRRAPYGDRCRTSLPGMDGLRGLQIGRRFSRAVREAVGGDCGCPYLIDLVLQASKLAVVASGVQRARQAVLVDDDLEAFAAIRREMGECAGHRDLSAEHLPAWLERERDRKQED